jgi:integrase
MAAHCKSLIREVLDRLDQRMALSESRGLAKEEARADGHSAWAFSTGKIHSYKTRSVYQEHVLNFANWARGTYGLKHLALIEERADQLATEYLQVQLGQGKSPYTLQTIRSALRLFFGDRQLANQIRIPRRSRSMITRSRGEKKHDRHFQPANWQPLINFLKATGLRRDELKMLKVGNILDHDLVTGGPAVFVANGKGGKSRTVPVLPGKEQDVLSVKVGRAADDLVFPRIPKHLDIHSYRREYAQSLYLYHASGWSLPSPTGRLRAADYDRSAAQRVTEALGHNRVGVVLRHYIR